MKNSSEIHIRPATEKDMPALLEFEQGVIAAERPFDPTLKESDINYYDLKYFLESPDVELLVAEADVEIIASGYARIMESKTYQQFERHAYLGFMYVKPAHRGKGINRLILDELKKWVLKQGITELRLEVYQENISAIKAYEKTGFKKHMIEMRMGLEE